MRGFYVGDGVPNITLLRNEFQDYMDVLLGRTAPPINTGISTLAEIANAYYSRAMEVTSLIHALELDGHVLRTSPLYKFRTGELRDFADIAKQSYELGSRRITAAQMESGGY